MNASYFSNRIGRNDNILRIDSRKRRRLLMNKNAPLQSMISKLNLISYEYTGQFQCPLISGYTSLLKFKEYTKIVTK